MKKLLAILGAVGLTATGASSVVACGSDSSEKNACTQDNISTMQFDAHFTVNNQLTTTINDLKTQLVNAFISNNSLNSKITVADFSAITIKVKDNNNTWVMMDRDYLWQTLGDGVTIAVMFSSAQDDQYIKGNTSLLMVDNQWTTSLSSITTLNNFNLSNSAAAAVTTIAQAKTALINALIAQQWPMSLNHANFNKTDPMITIKDFDLDKTVIKNGDTTLDDTAWTKLLPTDKPTVTFFASASSHFIKGNTDAISFNIVANVDISTVDKFTAPLTIDIKNTTTFNQALDVLISNLAKNSSGAGIYKDLTMFDFASISVINVTNGSKIDGSNWGNIKLLTNCSVTFTAQTNDKYISGTSKPIAFQVVAGQMSIADKTFTKMPAAVNNKTTNLAAFEGMVVDSFAKDNNLTGKVTVADFSYVIMDGTTAITTADQWTALAVNKVNVKLAALPSSLYVYGTMATGVDVDITQTA